MTSNQIAYWKLQEEKRSNLVDEQERKRSNIANEIMKAEDYKSQAERRNSQTAIDAANATGKMIESVSKLFK